jgi:urate oxidase
MGLLWLYSTTPDVNQRIFSNNINVFFFWTFDLYDDLYSFKGFDRKWMMTCYVLIFDRVVRLSAISSKRCDI